MPIPNFDPQTVQLAIVAVVALALLLQAIVLLAIFFTIRKAARVLREDFEDLRSSVMPIVDNTRELFVRVAPKVEETAEDLAAMAHGLRAQTADVQAAGAEILERLRRQSSRLDGMMSTLLDAIDHAGTFMTDAVAKPMRQLSSLLASARAVVESLRSADPAPHAPPARNPGDSDMFV
jgi:phage-related protein